MQLADDERGSTCYVCDSPVGVRFVQFNGPRRGDRMFLRICDECLGALSREHAALVAI